MCLNFLPADRLQDSVVWREIESTVRLKRSRTSISAAVKGQGKLAVALKLGEITATTRILSYLLHQSRNSLIKTTQTYLQHIVHNNITRRPSDSALIRQVFENDQVGVIRDRIRDGEGELQECGRVCWELHICLVAASDTHGCPRVGRRGADVGERRGEEVGVVNAGIERDQPQVFRRTEIERHTLCSR